MARSNDAPTNAVRTARWTFGIASAYGVLTLVPMFFFEPLIAARNPPALTHPEFFYGFLGLALAFQLLFGAIAWQPKRLVAAIPAAVAEKYLYAIAVGVLILLHRVHDPTTAGFAVVDTVLGTLFLLSFVRLRHRASETETAVSPGDGLIAKTLPRFLVVTLRTERFDARVLEPHYAYLADLRKKGLLLDAGGFGDASGGAYLISASSLEAAEAIAYTDPLHLWGASKLTVREWKSTSVDTNPVKA